MSYPELDIVIKQLEDEDTKYNTSAFVIAWALLDPKKQDTIPTNNKLFEPKLIYLITNFLLHDRKYS